MTFLFFIQKSTSDAVSIQAVSSSDSTSNSP